MTATTNGASLEDCLTNIFSLIDLNGIRWKRFKHKDNAHHPVTNTTPTTAPTTNTNINSTTPTPTTPNNLHQHHLYTPIDTHPILTTYAKCIEENHIAVWRHEPQKRYNTNGPNNAASSNQQSGGHSNFPTPTRTSNNNTPTSSGPNSSTTNTNNTTSSATSSNNQNNLELWIFGYGNQLKVDNVINTDELVEIEDDTWESKGLSYECRTLLFKALHNLIERCLIAKGFTKIGRWFVQPLSENLANHQSSSSSSSTTSAPSCSAYATFDKPSKYLKLEHNSITSSSSPHSLLATASRQQHASNKASLSSTISSTINRIIEYRKELYDSKQSMDKTDGLRHTSLRSSSTYFTTTLDGFKSSLSFAFSFFVHGDSTICSTVDVRQHPLVHPLTRADLNTFQEGGIVRVALAPYGLNGILNGVSYKDSDNGAATTTFIQQWSKFYPLIKTLARLVPYNKSSINNGAIATNLNQKTQASNTTASNQYNSNDQQNLNSSRLYLSTNLTNMLLPPTQQKPHMYFNYEPDEVPPVVEVIVAGYRMRYPSECVFTTSKVLDPYKSLNNPIVRNNMGTTKRLVRGAGGSNQKMTKGADRSNDDKMDLHHHQLAAKVKIDQEQDKNAQSTFNSPFILSSKDTSLKDNTNKSTIPRPDNKQDGSDCINNNSSNNQNMTMSRYNSGKVGFGGSAATPLGPFDISKIYPTPPSLEQIILSPSNITDDTAKDTTTATELPKDNGIDVYKPVECALMPPPPKWAALTNIIISSSKSLPPECVYKCSSQNSLNTKSMVNRLAESAKGISNKLNINLIKRLDSNKDCTNFHQSIASPLTDQTNKNGFNLNISSPKTPITTSLVANSPSVTNFNINSSAGSILSSMTSASTTTPTSTTFSSFTSPHQRIFNNLHEVNSVQLNLLISDSILAMFKDHNFESCTLCVCNMSIKGTQNDTVPQKTDNNTATNPHWKQSIGSDSLLGGGSNSIPSGEYFNECTCGFSAINNRHCSYLSGLFLEDELEITNILYDPTEMIDQHKLYRRTRLSTYSDNSYTDEQKLIAKLMQDTNLSTNENSEFSSKSKLSATEKLKDDKSSQANNSLFEETKIFVIDQLKQQCSSTIHSNSSLSKILLIESFRNNRHLMSCTNYHAQTTTTTSCANNSTSPIYRFLDETNKYITVKMMNRNPTSLRFSDSCEFVKGMITKLGNQMSNHPTMRLANSLAKPMASNASATSGLIAMISRMFGSNRHSSILVKSNDSNNRNNIFIQGLQALVMPTLTLDPNGALQMLEHLIKDESKEALATLNKAILIFTSPMHDWQFLGAPLPENNFDVANLLKIIQPSLDESIGSHNKLYKDFVHQQQQHIFSARDSPTGAPTLPTPPCQGPLTWRQFHSSAGRGTEDQCEPQPIPSLLVGHHVEKNHLAVSPFALKFWDKLLLEPYAPGHNMFYIVITPDYQNILSHVNQFFKELSNTYEIMKLGKHTPISNGLIVADFSSSATDENMDDWFSKCGYSNSKDGSNMIFSRLRSYASKMNSSLAKTIVDFMEERQPPYDPHADRFDSSPNPQTANPVKHPQSSNLIQPQLPRPDHMRPFGTNPLGSLNTNTPSDIVGSQQADNQSTLDYMNNQTKYQSLIGGTTGHNPAEDNINFEDEASKQPGIVIYIVDPFSSPSITQNLRALAIIGLYKCYSMLLDNLPDNIKRITQLQLISLDSIISHSRPIMNISRVDQLKSLSMNVYSRCKKILTNQATAKSLTGFGPAAALESFYKTKKGDLCTSKMFCPPFILAPMKDKQTELGEMFGDRREKSSVLFCSYCITEDQRWLIASVTNDKGEMSETTVININIIDRLKRPKALVKRYALRKLMDFIISVMSDWVNPWRLIIGKLGRVGHGELKEWATLMSKRSLLKYSHHLTERCRQCTILPPTETVSILSACLVSLEPDSKLRIMPDQFTSDDRQASFNKCPLNTPEDASATHILVFPTSASIQSSHGIVEDPLAGSGLDDDLLNQLDYPLEDGIGDLGVEENMDDLFSAWDDNQNNVSDHINPHHDTMMSSSNLQMGSSSVGDNPMMNNQDETLQLLQQPLALGYYISTAKIGQMPHWFWSTSPHLRNSCPLFLKSALHIHMPCVQLSDDLLHSGVVQPRKSHQLDSNLTTDVLRYVLEGYNSLSWLALNPKTYDRQSCLPVHMQNLLQLYHLMESLS